MLHSYASTRSAARGGTARRRGVCLAVGAVLIANSFAAADEPGRGVPPAQGAQAAATSQQSRTVRPLQGPVPSPLVEITPKRAVRSANWTESTDGAAGAHSRRVTPAGGTGVVNADVKPTDVSRGAETKASGVAPARFDVPAAEPLSRFAFPESSTEFDPGQTLRDWAEGAGLMLAFGVVALWLLRQWITRRDLPGGAMSHLRTIESLALPQRCRIHLVEVDGRQVLVAADAAGIKSVTVMPERFGQLLDVTDEEAETAVTATTSPPEPTRTVAWHGLQESRPA